MKKIEVASLKSITIERLANSLLFTNSAINDADNQLSL